MDKGILELHEIKNENQVWKFLNKFRKKEIVKNDITELQWVTHFKKLLEGTSERIIGEKRRNTKAEEDSEKSHENKSYLDGTKIKEKKGGGFRQNSK